MTDVKSSKIRRGLVLEGGGAKGAWQFGVLKALSDAGIDFDYVAGSSVGALNGALWVTKRLDIGENLWTNLKRSEVFLLRPLIIPLFLVGFITRVFSAYVKGYIPDSSPRTLKLILKALLILPFNSWLILGIYLLTRSFEWQDLFMVPFLLVFMFYMVRERIEFQRVFFLVNGAVLSLLVLTSYIFWGHESPNLPTLLKIIIWLNLIPLAIFCIGVIFNFVNLSVFDPSPLRAIINNLMQSEFRTPLFATVAVGVPKLIDPDNFDCFPNTDRWGVPTGGYSVVEHSKLVPIYVRVDNLDSADKCEILLASSALPLGIAPWRRDSEKNRMVDGGTIDNVPWHPLIQEAPSDEIIIVGCNPLDRWDQEKKLQEWQEADRLARVVQMAIEPDSGLLPTHSVKNIPPTVVPMRQPSNWPKRVVLIAPSKPLGTFLSGTLNFSAEAARRRMAEGYQRAIDIIEKEFHLRIKQG